MPDSSHEDVVRESFRHQAGAFSGAHSVYAHQEGPFDWIGPLDTSMVVLEVACGAAHASESIAPFVHEVIGVDLTPELLEVGRDRIMDLDCNNVLLQVGNAEALPFVRDSFDVAFCRGSLHHFKDPLVAINEMKRVVKPGGRIVLLDLVVPPGIDGKEFDRFHRLLDPSHVQAFDEDGLAAALKPEADLTFRTITNYRFPIDVSLHDLSDRDSVVAGLRAEIAGGTPTGFEPAEEDGTLIVSFLHCTVHGTMST